MVRAEAMARTPSVKAMAPAARSRPNSANSLPAQPDVAAQFQCAGDGRGEGVDGDHREFARGELFFSFRNRACSCDAHRLKHFDGGDPARVFWNTMH